MTRGTTNMGRDGRSRSPLEVLPPSQDEIAIPVPPSESPVESRVRERKRKRRKETVVPVSQTPPELTKTSSSKSSTSPHQTGNSAQQNGQQNGSSHLVDLAVAKAGSAGAKGLSKSSQAVSSEKSKPTQSASSPHQWQAISQWHEEDLDEPMDIMSRLTEFMSGWATSFIVHTLLLILLALLTLNTYKDDGVSLSAVEVDSPVMDISSVEIDVNLDPLDSASEAELEDTEIEDLTDDLSNESLEAPDINEDFADFGMAALSSVGAQSKGDGGDSSSGKSEGKSGDAAEFFGASAEGDRFVFVIDCSGSMEGERWRRAKYELERSINELGPEQQFSIILYNSFTAIVGDTNRVQLAPANAENKEFAFDWLHKQFPGGGTYPRQAMTLALTEMPDAIFLLSDGEIQDNTYEFLLANNRNLDRGKGEYGKIPVHTIALLSTFGQRMLKAIADDNEGTFTRVGQ